METGRVHIGDAREWAKTLAPNSIQMICTSPPYFGLRDYGTATWEGGDPACDHIKPSRQGTSQLDKHGEDGQSPYLRQANKDYFRGTCGKCGAVRTDQQIGIEATVGEYVANLVGLFRDLRTALRDDGTLWLNLGDSYAGGPVSGYRPGAVPGEGGQMAGARNRNGTGAVAGIAPKNLIGIPWRVAFALQDDGWILRSAITWCKPNAMPESVRDRPTSATEMLFLLAKNPTYYYDSAAIAEPISQVSIDRISQPNFANQTGGEKDYGNGTNPARSMRKTLENFAESGTATRNKRNWWVLPTAPYPGSHYAVMPPELVRPCILAGTSARGACAACGAPWRRVVEREPADMAARYERGEPTRHGAAGAAQSNASNVGGYSGGVRHLGWEPSCTCGTTETVPCLVIDPFLGSGTVAAVAIEEGRRWAGCDLDERNAALVAARLDGRQLRLGVA